MKVRFVFHKPSGERAVGKAIVAWTWLLAFVSLQWKRLKYDYSHEELWLPNEGKCFYRFEKAFEEWNPHLGCFVKYSKCIFSGQCFSSTTRGNAEGVRFAPAAEVLGKHPERWDYIECEVSAERLEVAVEEAKKLVGKKYDYLGLFGFFQPFVIEDNKKWYCSEILDWLKVLLGLYPKRYKRISPRRAAQVLARKWGEPKKLKGE